MFGDWNASTMTIVFPLPSKPALMRRVDVVGVPHLIRVVTGHAWAEANHLAGEEAIVRTGGSGWDGLRADLEERRRERACPGHAPTRWHQGDEQGYCGQDGQNLPGSHAYSSFSIRC